MKRSRLRRETGLRRRTPLREMSDRRAKAVGRKPQRDTGPDRTTRDLVLNRDGGCVMCGAGPYGVQVHHRKPRRMGGRSDRRINATSNLVTLCPADHQWAESRRAEALDMGLLLRESDDPAEVPVEHAVHDGLVLLDDAGGWRQAGQDGAA